MDNMPFKLTLKFVLLLIFLIGNGFGQSAGGKRYRLCIPRSLSQDCEVMRNELAGTGGRIDCVTANDKIGCIQKVARDEADFMPLDPEEIYVANKFKDSAFGIISEIRSDEFKNRDFRYEPVAVIRNSAKIKSISDLKGKRSCHTGFGRNAGWKVPFSHLLDKNEISKFCDDINAPIIERDMYAFSQYFGSACAPGKWVPDDGLDRSLKQKYSQLCKLCKSSDCSDKDGDGYIGYEGALMCLTQNDGDVAWTKMDAVQKHFQLKERSGIPIASQFSFLCWDGSSVPLTSENPCSWAKRPWQAFLASTRFTSASVKDLQDQLSLHSTAATEQSSKWRKLVLEMAPDSGLYHYPQLDNTKTYSPTNYLSRGNYSVTVQKPSCSSKNIRICVENGFAQEKCTDLRMAATGRRIRPTFECILSDKTNCLDFIKQDNADLMFTGAKDADRASKNGMTIILSELESTIFNGTQTAPFRYAVAVVRSDSNISSLKDLQGRKSCHGSISSLAGWNIPLSVLRDNKLISGPNCGLPEKMASFFNESCVPGALDKRLDMPWLPKSFCKLCAGDQSGTPSTFCVNNNDEPYYGAKGALKCLKDGIADVAFVDHVILNTINFEEKTGLKPADVRLLCPKGGQQKYTEFHHCNWGKIPTRKIIAQGGDNYFVKREDAKMALLKASDLFRPGSKSETIYKLFGSYYGSSGSDLLFRDSSVGLSGDIKSPAGDNNIIQEFDYCTTSSGEKLVMLNKFIPLILVIPLVQYIFH